MDKIKLGNPAASFMSGMNNALSANLARDRRRSLQKQEKFNDEQRSRKRKAWTREDRDREVLSKIDLVKPYTMNKEYISKLSPDSQAKILEYYAKNDKRERERHKEFAEFSYNTFKNIMPMVNGPESYAAARQAIFNQVRRSGLVSEEEIKNTLEPAFPEEYDPQWVKIQQAVYGYKPPEPVYKTLSPQSQLYKDGKLVAENTNKKGTAKEPPTTEKALSEIAKAKVKIAKLSQTGGMDSMEMLTRALTGDRKELEKDMQTARVSKETKAAILAQKDIIDHYAQFLEPAAGQEQPATQDQQKQDPQTVYNQLRSEGLSHEQAVAKMQEMGF